MICLALTILFNFIRSIRIQ